MRIAVWHNLPSGGGKRALYDQVSGLLERGHEVESWCPPTADQTFLPLGDLVAEHVVPMTVANRLMTNQAVNRLSKGATVRLARLRAMEEHSRRCTMEISDSRFDVLLAASSEGLAVTGLAKYLKLPTVLYLQEPHRPLYEAHPRLPWPALPKQSPGPIRVLQHLREAAFLRALRIQAREELEGALAYDRLLANSYFSRESMLRAYGIEARVCYLGVDLARYVDRGAARRHMVVGIGRFAGHKRVDAAIRAVGDIPAPRPSLTWIGDVADERYLQTLHNLAARQGVTFHPLVAIPAARVVDVLNEAAVMVYAPRLEPFGYAPLEAAACGLPVVAKAEGGVRECVIDGVTGFLVESDAGLGPALQRVLADKDLAKRMGSAARHNSEVNWSLDAATARLEFHLLEVARTAGVRV